MNEITTANVKVTVPFDFCEKCRRMRLDSSNAYMWHDGSPIDYEYWCANSYICANAIKLYEGSRNENNAL